MASIYSILFSKLRGNMLPIDKRLPKFRAFIDSLLSPIQTDNNLFVEYMDGVSGINRWSSIPNYSIGARVIYLESVYICIVGGLTVNKPPDSHPEIWQKQLDSIFGMHQREKFNSQKYVLEYALNTLLNQTFVQPPAQNPIYLQRVGYAGSIYEFAVMVPVAVYNSIPTSNRDKYLRSFINKYIPAGWDGPNNIGGVTVAHYVILTY